VNEVFGFFFIFGPERMSSEGRVIGSAIRNEYGIPLTQEPTEVSTLDFCFFSLFRQDSSFRDFKFSVVPIGLLLFDVRPTWLWAGKRINDITCSRRWIGGFER
jgi:hypothetical protein